jgi:hypothetical protein
MEGMVPNLDQYTSFFTLSEAYNRAPNIIMSQYSYCPLQAGQNRVRLLRLLPAEDDEAEIQCELFDYSLDDSRRTHLYEALSYVWGDPKQTRPILMHGHRFEVTVNLHAALLRLRNHAVQRVLWVDAMCINQADQKEKEHQIQAMANIYGRANRMVVWLGEAADGSDEAIEQIRVGKPEMYKRDHHAYSSSEEDDHEEDDHEGSDNEEDDSWEYNSGEDSNAVAFVHVKATTLSPDGITIAPLHMLLQRPWFRRVWVRTADL